MEARFASHMPIISPKPISLGFFYSHRVRGVEPARRKQVEETTTDASAVCQEECGSGEVPRAVKQAKEKRETRLMT
ncbi:hypothetical protein TNCV_4462201 [Trichonephila clavipes]|nr:hypothetical protein TNCV_4462201 [Trichonephila clavipes]